jgi:hypothetical protein
MLVRCDPPQAEIFLDGHLEGRADADGRLEIPFDNYGTRTLVARAPGYVPTRQSVELEVPWYQVFPLGLFSDLLWPGTIRDDHSVDVTLVRRGKPRPAAELEAEASQFRIDQERP